VSVRRTSGALGLRSEASIRFEKGLHPELAANASRRAMKLLLDIAGGRATKGIIDQYPGKRADTRVVVTRRRIEQVLGSDLPTPQVRAALADLGFGCRWVPPDRYVVRVPYWRTDVAIADDVVEELARVTGYDRIEPLPLAGAMPVPDPEPLRELRERMRDAAAAAGLQEVITYPLTTPELLLQVQPAEALEVHPPLRLENPMSSEQAVMRTSLRASMLQTVAANLRRDRGTVALFECARVYLTRPDDLPEERELLIGALGGFRLGSWGEPTSERLDFFDAKGLVEALVERSGAALDFMPYEEYGLLRGETAGLRAGEDTCGVLGQVHPRLAAQFEIEGPVFLFEIDVGRVLQATQKVSVYRPLSRYPAVYQDLAVLVDASVSAAQVEQIMRSSALVAGSQLFDVYEGPPLPEGKRSLAYAVRFQSLDKTLTETDVADARRRIIRRLERELGAELRGA
jgi:phenylalanyl-tRNA synthetase beta chain